MLGRTPVLFACLLFPYVSFAQATSGADLYQKGMNALVGAGPSRNDHQAFDWRSSATRSVTAHGCTGWTGEFDDHTVVAMR